MKCRLSFKVKNVVDNVVYIRRIMRLLACFFLPDSLRSARRANSAVALRLQCDNK